MIFFETNDISPDFSKPSISLEDLTEDEKYCLIYVRQLYFDAHGNIVAIGTKNSIERVSKLSKEAEFDYTEGNDYCFLEESLSASVTAIEGESNDNDHFSKEDEQQLSPISADSDSSDSDLFLLPNPNYDEIMTKQDDGQYSCIKCSQVSMNASTMLRHVEIHMQRSTICMYCGKSFPNSNYMKIHESKHFKTIAHANGELQTVFVELEEISSLKPSCQICGKNTFRSPTEYNDHQNTHTKVKPYHCSCGSKFSNGNNFVVHRRRLKCPLEGSKYPEYAKSLVNRNLDDGSNRHTISKPASRASAPKRVKYPNGFVCEICQQEFPRASQLQSHIRHKHTAKTIPCPNCSKLFSSHADMSYHLHSHLIQTKCAKCGELVATSRYLGHLKRIHPEEVAKAIGLEHHVEEDGENCPICHQKVDENQLIRHFTSDAHNVLEIRWMDEHNLEAIQCDICSGVNFECIPDAVEHFSTIHELPLSEVLSNIQSYELNNLGGALMK